MIYLIGGPPRCGKTTLAKSLSRTLRCGWIPVDALEIIVSKHTPTEDYKERFPKTVLCEENNWDNDPLYDRTPVSEIVDGYRVQGTSSANAIEQFVEHCLYEGHDFIVEGHQLHPSLVAKLQKRFPAQLRAIFLYKQDVSQILKGFQKNKGSLDWVTQKTKNKQTLSKIADMLSLFGAWFESEASSYGFRSCNMDIGFKKKIRSLTQELKKQASPSV
jgi:adenylate kinase family enzyme